MNRLTNDAKFLLTAMYGQYIQRRQGLVTKSQARNFIDAETVKQTLMPEWTDEDVVDTCLELHKHGYVEGSMDDDTIFTLSLTTEAVAELEVLYQDKLDLVNAKSAELKATIPYIQ